MKKKYIIVAASLLMLIGQSMAMGLAGSTFGVGPGTLAGSVSGPNPVMPSSLAGAPGGNVPGTSYWNWHDSSTGRTFFYAYNTNAAAYFYGGATGYYENGIGITPEGIMSGSGIRGMSNGMGGSFGNGAGAF